MISRTLHELLSAVLFATVLMGINSSPTAEAAPPPICSGQTLIAIDPSGAGPGGPFKDGVGYVPIYALDATGNAQLAVVDLTVGLANPVLRGISLPGSNQPIGLVYNPNNKTVLAEARQSSTNAITIYEIDTTTQTLIHSVAAPGLSQDESEAASLKTWLPIRPSWLEGWVPNFPVPVRWEFWTYRKARQCGIQPLWSLPTSPIRYRLTQAPAFCSIPATAAIP